MEKYDRRSAMLYDWLQDLPWMDKGRCQGADTDGSNADDLILGVQEHQTKMLPVQLIGEVRPGDLRYAGGVSDGGTTRYGQRLLPDQGDLVDRNTVGHCQRLLWRAILLSKRGWLYARTTEQPQGFQGWRKHSW